MAETIDISAVARVIDQASGPLKAISGVITGVGEAAKQTSSIVSGMSRSMAGTVGQMVGGLGRAGDQVAGFGKKIAGMFGPLSGLAGAASLAGITAGVTSFIAACQELDKASQTLHLNAASLLAFRDAAGGPEAANTALGNLQKTLENLKAGGKDTDSLGSLLHRMGVSAKEIADGNLDVILPKIADGFKANVNPALQAKAAVALFGAEIGPKLLPYLSKGAAGIAELAKEAGKLDIIQKMQAGLDAGKAMDALGQSVTNAKNAISAAVLPAFVPMVNVITDFVNANRELLKQTALPFFIGSIATAVISLGLAITRALGPWGLLVAAIVAGATAIYQNWDKVKDFFDSTLPGFLPALEQAGASIASWAKQASADITAGFQTGGISGGLQAIWQVFKSGWSDAIAWLSTMFASIDWAAVGNTAASLMWQAMVAIFNSQASLGQIILDRFNQVDWSQLGTAILNGIGTMYSQAGDLLAGLRGLDWQSVGAFVGKVFVDTMLLVFVKLPLTLAQVFENADWSAIGAGILKYMAQLVLTIGSIGADLITGLIKGMMDAVPGLSKVADAIVTAFGKVKDFFAGIVATAASIGTNIANKLSTPVQGPAGMGGPDTSLLRTPGAATGGVQTQRSEVAITNTVNAPPGSTVTTTTQQKGAPVEVGASGVGTGSP